MNWLGFLLRRLERFGDRIILENLLWALSLFFLSSLNFSEKRWPWVGLLLILGSAVEGLGGRPLTTCLGTAADAAPMAPRGRETSFGPAVLGLPSRFRALGWRSIKLKVYLHHEKFKLVILWLSITIGSRIHLHKDGPASLDQFIAFGPNLSYKAMNRSNLTSS